MSYTTSELIENNICIKCYSQSSRIAQKNLMICTKNCTLHRCTKCGYVQETWLVENYGYDAKDIERLIRISGLKQLGESCDYIINDWKKHKEQLKDTFLKNDVSVSTAGFVLQK